jgi:hypothetical protein
MDQNSSNGSGKTNWREKLGIGTGAKELPKISDEFKPAGPAANPARPQRVEPKIVAKPAPRAPHVVKPAPMAPRPAQAAAPSLPAKPAEAKPESLAERLKSQRQAAERLAEQRISTVRDSVKESKTPPAPAKPPEAAKPKTLSEPASEAPKFSFAEEELASAKADASPETGRRYVPTFPPSSAQPAPVLPPLVPPRPALGGDKPVLPTTKQDPVGYAGAPGGGYRPLDPPAYQPQRPISPAAPPRPAYGESGGGDVRQPSVPARRDAFDNGRRPPMPRIGNEAGEAALPIGGQRGGRPLPQRPRRPASYDDDLGEVFEDEEAAPPPRRRARAQDYSQAYREYEDNYEEDDRRSAGPWLLLLALLVLALLAFGGIWYYSKFMTPQGVQQTGDAVPVVPKPKELDKVTQPDTSAAAISPEPPAPAVKKKLIYDRILGDQTIEGGTMVPTEEAPKPIPPDASQARQAVPSAASPESQSLQPAPGTAVEPPQPDAPANTQVIDPSNSGADQTEPLPLPVPPTPGSSPTEGSLTPVPAQRTAVAMTQPTVSPAAATSQDAPPLEDATASTAGADDAPAVEPQPSAAQQQPSTEQIEEPSAPAKPKARTVEAPAKQKKKVKPTAQKEKAQNPVVLVPPSSSGSEQAVAVQQVQSETSSGSFFGDGKGESRALGKQDDRILTSIARKNFSSKQANPSLAADTQVASVEPAEPQAAKSSGNGYVAQLASFRSEAEALSEFDRLKGKHGGILGGKSARISKGTVGGTTRYRLGVGPIVSRDEASKLCNSLIASGERDCIVKQQ